MTANTRLKCGLGLVLASAMTLGACASRQDPSQASVEYRNTGNTAPPASAPAVQPGAPISTTASGIVSYDGYDAIIAQNGDTVSTLANRAGLAASELGAYNGLAPDQPLRAGDELVLPPRPGGYGATQVAAASAPTGADFTPAPLESSIETTTIVTESAGAPAEAGAGSWSPDIAAAAIDRSAEPPVSPVAVGPGTIMTAEAAAAAEPGADAPLSPPPSSTAPLPAEPTRPNPLDSPNLGQYQTPSPSAPLPPDTYPSDQAAAEADKLAQETLAAASPSALGARPTGMENLSLTRPVNGPVVSEYNSWGPGGTRNEGVDFGASAGTPVVAAADGTVALVSPSLGGLGTIVVLRHPGEVLTVYGRIDGVSIAKGANVRRGQTIGQVANPPQGGGDPRMHFEVRRGATSVDPMLFF